MVLDVVLWQNICYSFILRNDKKNLNEYLFYIVFEKNLLYFFIM